LSTTDVLEGIMFAAAKPLVCYIAIGI